MYFERVPGVFCMLGPGRPARRWECNATRPSGLRGCLHGQQRGLLAKWRNAHSRRSSLGSALSSAARVFWHFFIVLREALRAGSHRVAGQAGPSVAQQPQTEAISRSSNHWWGLK